MKSAAAATAIPAAAAAAAATAAAAGASGDSAVVPGNLDERMADLHHALECNPASS